MKITKTHNLACPIDGDQLESHGKQLVCANGHSFDIARQGYVNLLPVQHKRTKQPGDSNKMIVARTQFLNTGAYEPIANKIAELIFTQITCPRNISDKEICLMDAGCGEGYYFDWVFNALKNKESDIKFSFIGLDISKDAIIASTKRNKQISWVVGTNRQPPVSDYSVDIILCVFGFHSYKGFNKILKPNGRMILVEPGPEHLKELREVIYKDVKHSDSSNFSHENEQGFSLINQDQLKFRIDAINNESINNLLIMTPHLYRASKEGKEAASNLKEMDLTVDVIFRVLEKIN